MQLLDFHEQAKQFTGPLDIMAVTLQFGHTLSLIGDNPFAKRRVPLAPARRASIIARLNRGSPDGRPLKSLAGGPARTRQPY